LEWLVSGQIKDDGDWVRRFHPVPDARVRLVCFPHAGGSANYFFPVSRALSGTMDVLCLQYPGRQDRRRERCVETIAELADRIVAALRPWADRPLAFFGHSMGAILAFEVALRFKAEGITPAIVFVSGRRAPSTHRVETVHLLPDSALVQEIRGLDGTQSALLDDEDIVGMILPALRADYRAVETYQNLDAGTIDSPLITLLGEEDAMVTRAEGQAWAKHTTNEFELRVYPGGHFYLNAHAADVIAFIKDRVDTYNPVAAAKS
jgi:pyochelin biosynthesis protein PchC